MQINRSSRAAWGYLGAALIAALAYLALPDGSLIEGLVFVAAHLSLVVVLWVGTRESRTTRPGPWIVILVAMALYALANFLFFIGPLAFDLVLPYPSFVDGMYIVAQAAILFALGALVVNRASGNSAGLALDVAIIAVGAAALAWHLAIAGVLTDPATPVLAKVVSTAYPLVNVITVAVLSGLLFIPGQRPPSLWLLIAALCFHLTGDLWYAQATVSGTFALGGPMFVVWVLAYGLLGAAALHPSLAALSRPNDDESPVLTTGRLTALGVTAAVPLGVLVLNEAQKRDIDHLGTSLMATVIVLMVILRLATLGREVAARREHELRLAAAHDRAVEMSEVKSQFLATMSHEIRTPLNAVIGMSGLLAETDLNDEQRPYASGIRIAGETLLHLINDILDLSKIEAGRLELEVVDFDLERLIEDVADLFADTARMRGLELYSYLQPDVPRALRADAGRIRQILVNLVGNALKFTTQGSVVIRARRDHHVPEAELSIRLEVIDTGVGMDTQTANRIFEAFTQADDPSSPQQGGTGLGLAICTQLVDLMGGRIGVVSAPGEGSTFWVTVPMQPALQPVEDRTVQPLHDVPVLLIFDKGLDRTMIRDQVQDWGMRPSVAADAREALRVLQAAGGRDRFKVALVDLGMAAADVMALAEGIRSDARLRDIGLIAVSADSAPTELQGSEKFDAHLRTPVRQSELYDAMMSLLLPGLRSLEPVASARAAPPRASRGTVLLVEDNPANQLVGQHMIEKLGFRVDIASDGSEALDALKLRRYEAVLMDCRMPVLDGYEATRKLRQHESSTGAHTPVIALTASATTEERQHCIAAGMDDFVSKPVRSDALAAALDRWGESARPHRNARTDTGVREERGTGSGH